MRTTWPEKGLEALRNYLDSSCDKGTIKKYSSEILEQLFDDYKPYNETLLSDLLQTKTSLKSVDYMQLNDDSYQSMNDYHKTQAILQNLDNNDNLNTIIDELFTDRKVFINPIYTKIYLMT